MTTFLERVTRLKSQEQMKDMVGAGHLASALFKTLVSKVENTIELEAQESHESFTTICNDKMDNSSFLEQIA